MTHEDLHLVAKAGTADFLYRNGLPADGDVADRRLARAGVADALGGFLLPDGLQESVLGIDWTQEFVAHVRSCPPAEDLWAREWLPLDPLYRAVGLPSEGRWAVRLQGRVLATVRIVTDVSQADPAREVLDRCRRRGEVRLLEMAELAALHRHGVRLPVDSDIVRAAADMEGRLGGRELVAWTSGRALPAPVRLPAKAARRGPLRQLVLACSGVDGSGKSTLASGLADDFARAGLPAGRVWLRPGMGLGPLARIAGEVKQRLGQNERPGVCQTARPGVRTMAEQPGTRLPSRRGIVGWLWVNAVTVAFLGGVRRQHAEAGRVVIYDRHLLDASATLDFVYQGADLTLARFLLRRLIPAARVTFYLDTPDDVAVARKPGDPIGLAALKRQLQTYRSELPARPDVHVLVGTEPVERLRAAAFEHVIRTVLLDGQ